jgi:hypothetical protein
MIISDLQYIESANESEVQGAGGKYYSYDYKKPKYIAPKAVAEAGATAEAVGKNTYTATGTETVAVAGVFSSSSSGSLSVAKGYVKY